MVDNYNEAQFLQDVERALGRVRQVLDNARSPKLPAAVSHKYNDKYTLAEFVVRTGTAAILHCFARMGLTPENLKKLKEFATNRSVTLRFKAEKRCKFQKKVTREVDSKTKHVTEVRGTGGGGFDVSSKVVTTIEEWLWDYTFAYEVIAFRGASPDEGAVVFQGRQGAYVITTRSKDPPHPEVSVLPSIDAPITWFLNRAADGGATFTIDRTNPKTCLTPRRNPDVSGAFDCYGSLYQWFGQVDDCVRRNMFQVQTDHGLNLSAIEAAGVFVPVVPLFEDTNDDVCRPMGDVNMFMAEQSRSLDEKLGEISAAFPVSGALTTAVEASLLVVGQHARKIMKQTADGLNYVEQMLFKGIVAAVGKVISAEDFGAYMLFHNRRLFRPEFAPVPFSYAVRRPDHYPEGVVSIQNAQGDPLPTMVRCIRGAPAMQFALNATTNVTFHGERYLHSMVNHQFSGTGLPAVDLTARARQFSSFVVLVGRIQSASLFVPEAAIVVQNKDDVSIPLKLATIPTPKEFKDAISALSPEQQRFAKAYRSMQLSATLFGVCVIQIKPQLEKLLNLPYDSLTKEIRLMQDILDLFLTYQIPSDQLKFDGDPSASPATKIQSVKDSVKAMQEMIEDTKKVELEEAKNVAKMNIYESGRMYEEDSCDEEDEDDCDDERADLEGFHRSTSSRGKAVAAPEFKKSLPKPQAPKAQPRAPATSAGSGSPAQQPQPGQQEVVDSDIVARDVTKLPKMLDDRFLEFDEDSALRPTIISLGEVWTRRSCKTLLSPPVNETLNADEQLRERNKAFDLLDALSRSGALDVDAAELHVVVASTHCFDKTCMDVLVKGNVNPIEKVERSVLIAGATIHALPPSALVSPASLQSSAATAPALFAPGALEPQRIES